MDAKLAEEVMEDWYSILHRPGMNVLATFLVNEENYLRSQLENPQKTGTYEAVSQVRGGLDAIRKVKIYLKSEYDRAAKSDTPEKEK